MWHLLVLLSALSSTGIARRTKIMDFSRPSQQVGGEEESKWQRSPPASSKVFQISNGVEDAPSSDNGRQLEPKVGAPDDPDDDDDLPEGWICMKKVVMEEETAWDYEEKCHHVTTQNCYQAFRTEYVSQKV